MFCVFNCDTSAQGEGGQVDPKAAAMKGVLKWKRQANIQSIREAEAAELHNKLSALNKVSTNPEAENSKKLVELCLAEGVNGLTYLKGPNCSFATSQEEKTAHVSCYFRGDLTQKRINEIHIDRHLHDEDDCHKIIHMYVNASTIHNGFATKEFCFTSLLADELKDIHGPYAFVLYDKMHKRVVAARDPDGKEPLYWASHQEDHHVTLYFSTDRLALFESAESIAEFPAGGLYISESGRLCGSLNGKPFISTKSPKKGAKGRTGVAHKRTTGKAAHVPSRSVALGGSASSKAAPKPRILQESSEQSRFGKSAVPNLRHKPSPKEAASPPAPPVSKSPFDRKNINRARHALVEE